MATSAEFLIALAAMAAASYACRLGGFVAMRFVAVTPRLEAALRAVPLSVMIGIAAPALADGGDLPEWAGLAAVVLTMRLTRNDPLAAVVGVAAVAVARAIAG
jgi:uncharacterized membrane protein